MSISDEAAGTSRDLQAGEIPKLGPRVWWCYLTLEVPHTIDELASKAGISDSGVRAPMRTLITAGLVRLNSAKMYERAIELPQAELAKVTKRVNKFIAASEATRNARTQFTDPVGDVPVRHELGWSNPRSRGTVWYSLVRCACGWREEVTGLGEASTTRQAIALWAVHAPGEAAKAEAAAQKLTFVVAGIVLVIVLLVGFLGVKIVGNFTDSSGVDDTTSYTPSESGGIDCDESVTQLMESLYGGSWGGGEWPDGEFGERLDQCRGD